MNERLQQLYREVILTHSKNPHHFAKKPEAEVSLEAYNPLCGDQFHLYFDLTDDGIGEIYFHGYGCSISKAATSLLTQQLSQQPRGKILTEIDRYLAVIDPTLALPDHLSEEYAAFAAARQFSARQQCARLSWETLQTYLSQ